MSDAEYNRCHAQYEVTKKIVEAYEEKESNFTKILELLQQVRTSLFLPRSLHHAKKRISRH